MVSIAVARRQTGLSQITKYAERYPRSNCMPSTMSSVVSSVLAFFNCDHAVLADLLHSLGDDGADCLVAIGGDRVLKHPDVVGHPKLPQHVGR